MDAPHPDSLIRAPSGRAVELKVHRCNWSGVHPENSLSALEECSRERVLRVEIDVQMLRDAAWAVFHDDRVDRATTASGRVRDLTAVELSRARFRGTSQRVPLLSEALALIANAAYPRTIELDLKADAPIPWPRVEELARAVEPAKARIVFGGTADWNLRRLLSVDPTLPVSLNPHAYLDYGERNGRLPAGAYGYLDAHPLARRRLGSVGDYLRDRFGGVMRLVPGAREAHLRLRMFEKMLDDGVGDAAEIFHALNVKVDVWTLDAGMARWQHRLARALGAAVDIITTNTAHALAAAARAIEP
ncbi:MAG: glycerophosphodiester phosphodiesterase family protein [Chloroflexi bacterium]|nr:MAG: glycerophosphodiester phosphodiesterase family protein [Chloroflexota bacterium]